MSSSGGGLGRGGYLTLCWGAVDEKGAAAGAEIVKPRRVVAAPRERG